MAALEELIRSVADARIRDALAAEVARLKAGKKFGLVFEEHLPETVLLPGLEPKVGTRVMLKATPDAGSFRVIEAVNGKKVKIIPDHAAKSGVIRGLSESIVNAAIVVNKTDLIVAKAFGEPMYPALIPVDSVERAPGKPWHVLVNADNYHALQLLQYGYAGKVDVIYIDPPYNTGARDWKYNNNYVDDTDRFHHSKWLSMLKKRLRLAKTLLKPDGVLIVTIDEHEVGHLSCLLEEMFPEYLRHMVSAVINPKGTGKLNFARVDEYIFFCVPATGQSLIKGMPTSLKHAAQPGDGAMFYSSDTAAPLLAVHENGIEDDGEEHDDEAENEDVNAEEDEAEDNRNYPFPIEELADWELRHARRRGSESSYRHQRPNQFYPIYIDADARKVVRAGDSLDLEDRPSFSRIRGLVPVWPIDKEGNDRCWRFISTKMQTLIDADRVRVGRYNAERKAWTLNIWERKPESTKIKTVWWKRAHDAGTHGTTLLHNILGKRASFPFPKSIYAVMDALAAVVRTRPEAVILDFFSGSGTTLQATCMLNQLFGGNRRCVLVTNNEVGEKQGLRFREDGTEPGTAKYEACGICEAVTWPRIKSVITGQRPDRRKVPGAYLDGRAMADGFEANAAYFKLDFLDPDEVSRGEQFEAVAPILWMFAGCAGAPESVKGTGKWFMPASNRYAVLLREDCYSGFRDELARRQDIAHLFLVTDSTEAFNDMVAGLDPKYTCIQLYRSYIDTFRINLDEPGTRGTAEPEVVFAEEGA